MKKTLSVLLYEIRTLTSRFSFWFGIFGLPVISLIVLSVVSWINTNNQGDQANPIQTEAITQAFTQKEDNRPLGYVDEAGILAAIPAGFPADIWKVYPSQAEARKQLDAGVISAYYVIPTDYMKSGDVKVFMSEFRLVSTDNHSSELKWLLTYNLLKGNAPLTDAIQSPIIKTTQETVIPVGAGNTPPRDTNNMWNFFVPYAVMMLFYISILSSSGLLLNSVAKEKENRVMEVLLLSVSPQQMLMGKIIGLGLVGLFQIVVWILSGLTVLRVSGQNFAIPASVQLAPDIIVWGVIFFLLGYMVYAALMAGIGALVPNLREASQATIIVIMPLIVPLMMISALIESPNSPLAVGLSLFPLTAPTTMMLRLAAGSVPIWQPLLAIVLLAATDFLIIRAVSNMFRAQTLLSGQPFKIKNFFLALAGRG